MSYPPSSLITYEKRKNHQSFVKKLVSKNLKTFESSLYAEGKTIPYLLQNEFKSLLNCGAYGNGFLRFHCSNCNHNFLLPFSCKKRGLCSSCGARRMSQTASHLVDFVFPRVTVRQWVLSLPFPLWLRALWLICPRVESARYCYLWPEPLPGLGGRHRASPIHGRRARAVSHIYITPTTQLLRC